MDTALLETFVAVARARSFTAAARELGYVQSTVTGHIQTLEQRLGGRLFDRLPSGAVLTDAGQRLLPYAGQLLALEAQLRAGVAAATGPIAGEVRLTAPESVCAYRVPALVAALRAEAPEVRLALTPGGTAAALDAARNAATDLAVLLEPTLAAADLVLEPIGAERLVLLAAPTAAAAARSWTWADLAAADALLLEEGCSYSDDAVRRLLAAGQPATRRTRFGSIEATKQCVAAGLGWTVLPATVAVPELRARTLVALPGPPLDDCTVYLATHPKRTLAPAAQLVRDRLRGLWAASA